jgi:outer membrane immunogenic protein
MNKSLLASAALVGLTASSVFAADMRVKAPVKAPVVYDWTGFYIGANIGWSFGSQSTDFTIASLPVVSASHAMDGILGGIQDGYNWQSGNWVVGFESDIQATGQKGTSSLTDSVATTTTTNPCLPVASCPTTITTTANALATSDVRLQWFGTIRGRLGVTPSARWLVYATGGVAYGEVQTNESLLTGGATFAASTNTIHSGWTVGGGIEAALTDDWTAKVEYLYIDLGHMVSTFTGVVPFTPIATSTHVTDNIVRLGINYRFGPALVVAKY